MNRHLSKIRKYGKPFLLHSQVWLLLFILNYIFTRNYEVKFESKYQLYMGILYLVVFYLNFSLLMPFLLFRKKMLVYIVSSFVVIVLGTFLKREIDISRFEKRIQMEMGELKTFKLNDNDKDFKTGFFARKPFEKPPVTPEISQRGDRNVRPPMKRPPDRMILISFYSILLVYTGSISFRFIGKWQDDEKRKAEIEKENISTELSFLKQQINPHFLFNSLNSIYSLTITKSDKAVDSILKLSSILRYVLYESGTMLVNLHDELQILNDYIELQKLRITEKVKLLYTVKGNTGNCKIEPFILLPLIENAFKYGVDNYNESVIEILVAVHQNKLMLAVKNTIVKKSTSYNEGGIGIKNIKRRLDLLYPGEYTLEIDDSLDFYSVKLEINLKE